MESADRGAGEEVAGGENAAEKRDRSLPDDWGCGLGVERYDLRAGGWGDLIARYRGMGAEPLDEIFTITIGQQSPTHAVRECEYIDEDYRDEYANFYAKTYRPLPNRSERLHFYVEREDRDDGRTYPDGVLEPDAPGESEGHRYLGFVVLRPVIGRPVARTMVAPPWWVRRYVSCRAEATGTVHGDAVSVRGFPFISQDSQFGSCSHAAMWMISLYFHLRYRQPRRHISDFVTSARAHQDLPPSVPSRGLTPRQISAVLHDLDLQPVIYRLDRPPPKGETPESITCRYLNSGLPVMLLSGGRDEAEHAQVLIGYGRDADGLFFVHHDDQRGPYIVSRYLKRPDPEAESAHGDGEAGAGDGAPTRAGLLSRLGRRRRSRRPENGRARGTEPETEHRLGRHHLQALIVPLPGRIYLSGETAEAAGRVCFEEEAARAAEAIEKGEGNNRDLAGLVGGLDDGRLRLRSYLTEAGDYQRGLRGRGLPDEVVRWHLNINTSHWLWVVELQDRAAANRGRRCVVGELVIDATSDDVWVNALFGNLPGQLMIFPELGDRAEYDDFDGPHELYDSGCRLHVGS